MNIAAPFSFTGTTAQATASIFIVFQTVACYARAVLRQHSSHLLYALFERHFRAVQLRGALKNAVRQVWEIFFYPGDAKIQIHFVVIRRKVAVADRPIFSVTVPV